MVFAWNLIAAAYKSWCTTWTPSRSDFSKMKKLSAPHLLLDCITIIDSRWLNFPIIKLKWSKAWKKLFEWSFKSDLPSHHKSIFYRYFIEYVHDGRPKCNSSCAFCWNGKFKAEMLKSQLSYEILDCYKFTAYIYAAKLFASINQRGNSLWFKVIGFQREFFFLINCNTLGKACHMD